MHRALNALLCCLPLAGCASFSAADYRTAVITPAEGTMEWRGLPVATGQIIVNEHQGATALFLSMTASRFSPFMHAGIVVVEQGEPWVYESFGTFIPLPWSSPNEHMRGGVRRVTLEAFLLRGGITAIHEPAPDVDRSELARFARESWRRRVPFDGHYDPVDDSSFYCVEFVARALQAAGGDPVPLTNVSRNPSMRVAFDWLGIRGPGIQLAGDLVAGMDRTVLLSRAYSTADIARYFDLKRELHRRFTDDQKLGNVFYWKGQALHLRPAVERYSDLGMASAEDARTLAGRILGPMEDMPRMADAF